MIAGVSWVWWAGFHAVVVLLLVGDWSARPPARSPPCTGFCMARHGGSRAGRRFGFAGWIAVAQGRQPALEFVAGYTIETSLSVDNLFVFMVLFQGFRISRNASTRPCSGEWAGPFCSAASSSPPALRCSSASTGSPGSSACSCSTLPAAGPRRLGPRRHSRVDQELQPAKGSLLPVILAVEVTDLLFAVDSIPAVLAVSHNPFVVYTSNIAAVLGLRSLYFALAAMLDRFRYLHYGLGALLGFVALKMLAARWLQVPITLSLAVIGAILAVCAVASWIGEARDRGQGTGTPKNL